jgi:diguanylate cyclase (GGDEF)-like protein
MKATGIAGLRCTDHRNVLLALAAANLLGLAAIAVVPGSPGYLRAASWVAVGLGAVALAATARVRRIGAAGQAVAVAVSAAALAVALAGGEKCGTELYVSWFPWLGIYGGLVLSLPLAVGNAIVIVIGLVVGVSVASHGDLGSTAPFVAAVTAANVMAATLLVHRWVTWGVGQVGRDPVTSLANRSGLLREADVVLADLLAGGGRAVLVQLDIARFREVNVALGHAAGDHLLRYVAERLRQMKPEPMFVGRSGSDEFAVVISEAHLAESPAGANEQLHRLGRMVLRQIRGPLTAGGVEIEVEAHVGIAVAPCDGATLSTLMPRAEAAQRRARRDGKRVGLWDARIAGVRPWEVALYAELRAAVRQDELMLHYQLLQSAQTGRVAGVEALLRWNHPSRGLLPPGSFVPMAERSDLIIDVTAWVLDEAFRQCASWAAAGLHVPVSVNLSARMLLVDDLPDIVFERLSRHGVPADVLTLEITESALVTQPIRAAAMLRELRTQGVRFSLDDFGTGYNSMGILKALPFDEVKIDKGFVSDARGNLPDAAIVRTMLELGHRLGLRVVGEGVENQATLTMMTELGCDILQGDVLARPLPPADLQGILEARAGNPGLPSGGSCCGHTPSGEPSACSAGPADGDGSDGRSAGCTPAVISDIRLLRSPLPPDESERLAALRRYDILDTDPEPPFDEIAMLAAQVCDSTDGYISFIDADREWFKTCSGCCDCTELLRDNGVGTHVVLSRDVEEIPDLSQDARFAHLSALELPGLPRFICGVPIITPDGRVIGTVTVTDSVSRSLTPGQRRALAALARRTMALLEARRQAQIFGQLTDALQVLGKLWYPHELPNAAAALAGAARSILDADASTVVLSNIPGSTVFHAAASSTKAGEEPLIRPGIPYDGWDDTGIGEAMRTQKPVFFADPATSPLFPRQIAEHYRIGSALIVPVPGEGGLLGVVALRWTAPREQLDEGGVRAVTLLCGQAGHTLARLRSAQTRAQEFGTDPVTGLASRAHFIGTLQSLPVGTVIGLFAVPGESSLGDASEQVSRAFASHLRAVAAPAGHVAQWADNRFVLAVPGGGRPAAERLVSRLRAAWRAEKMPPFVVGFADTEPDLPPSAALIDAESSMLGALRTGGLGDAA